MEPLQTQNTPEALLGLLDHAIEYCDDDSLVEEAKSFSKAFANQELEVTVADDGNIVFKIVPLLARLVPVLCQSIVTALKLDKTRDTIKQQRLKRILPLLLSILHGLDKTHEEYRYRGPDYIFRQGSSLFLNYASDNSANPEIPPIVFT